MVQESVMICIDNSEYMRNGDYTPTRMQSQQDAVSLIMQAKLRANAENGVGMLLMAEQVKVISTITREDRKLFALLHGVTLKGESQFVSGLKIANLALRHRQNRNHKMRIVIFMGSPTDSLCETETLRMAKKLKKEKVSVDIICFGEAATNVSNVLIEFMNLVNTKENNSHLLLVTDNNMIDALYNSPICHRDGNDGVAALLGGVDPEEDPELALALRVSLEEQRQRQRMEEKVAAAAAVPDVDMESASSNINEAAREIGNGIDVLMSEDEQFQFALQLSIQDALMNDNCDESTPMDVDDEIGQLIEDPEMLQQLVDQMEFPESDKDANSGKDEDKKN